MLGEFSAREYSHARLSYPHNSDTRQWSSSVVVAPSTRMNMYILVRDDIPLGFAMVAIAFLPAGRMTEEVRLSSPLPGSALAYPVVAMSTMGAERVFECWRRWDIDHFYEA